MALVPQIRGMDGTDLYLGFIPSTDILEVTGVEGSQTHGQTSKDVFSRHCKAIGSFSYLPKKEKRRVCPTAFSQQGTSTTLMIHF